MKERYCRKCRTILTEKNTFPSWLKTHNNLCRNCWEHSRENKEAQKKYYRKNREKLIKQSNEWRKSHLSKTREYAKRYKKKIRLEVLEYYSKGEPECSCCKESHIEFLTIDHIKGFKNSPDSKEKRRRSGTDLYIWLKNHNYPGDYQVLCFNCNQSLGIWGYCPHNKNKIKDKYGEYK